eukprot:GGOE01057055.1.p1 GENE.GGOE01057055.1~~GGOE01057055.1.p1  ORF type:complete len:841 (-),score=278.42 GGOE01057055.1:72-2378(-)
MAQDMQALMISQAMEKLQVRLTEGENEMLAQRSRIEVSGLANYDLHPSRFDVQGKIMLPFQGQNFPTMRGHTYFSTVALNGALWHNGSTSLTTTRLFWVLWTALYVDLFSGTLGNRTLYQSTLSLQPDECTIQLVVSYANQITGALYPIQTTAGPAANFNGVMAPSGWDTDSGFNAYTGELELGLWFWIPAKNDSWLQASLSINTQTISEELGQQLAGAPDDRLVIYFTQPHGHMLAASHGKFYSHSDVDRRYINPLAHPPNLTVYNHWTCLQSNDVLIPVACQQLYNKYQSWTAIPDLSTEMALNGAAYWVAVAHLTTALKCTVVMLKNRASVMGSIDASSTAVDDKVASKKGVTFIVLGVVTAIAILLPLGVGLWLAAHLMRLAAGMDQIAKLQFNVNHAPPTMFRELHRFQMSFTQMERGLQAFGKFVPQAVVKVLIAGKMHANDQMSNETLTIMFADIEGFSTVCEKETPATLVTVCTEYFEAMCSNIIQHNGTIDKFIGDCIMAMWNAPERLPGHEREAVAAALAMQTSVMRLHHRWHQQGLPILKFRLGIHTGVCLVGNFGCSYRVSYTCLGDGVNLAARLEALNKKFGTNLCVSHATYEGCGKDFCFRKLAKVTVPGKAEVLPVYEVLCCRETAMSPDPPGSLRADSPFSDDVQLMSERFSEPNLIRVRSSSPGFDDGVANADEVPYHWQYVNRRELLEQSLQYEAAYSAMVVGDLHAAHQLLAGHAPLAIPDKAHATLADQLSRLTPTQQWDGVFYFREK